MNWLNKEKDFIKTLKINKFKLLDSMQISCIRKSLETPIWKYYSINFSGPIHQIWWLIIINLEICIEPICKFKIEIYTEFSLLNNLKGPWWLAKQYFITMVWILCAKFNLLNTKGPIPWTNFIACFYSLENLSLNAVWVPSTFHYVIIITKRKSH